MQYMSKSDKEAIFEDIDRLIDMEDSDPQRPDEFTAKEYEDHARRSPEWTRKKLNELCEAGILERRRYKNKYLYRKKLPEENKQT